MSSSPNAQIMTTQLAFEVDGQDRPALAGGLLGLVITENTLGLYHCEAKFGNLGNVSGQPDYLYFDRRVLEFGKTFKVIFGSDTLFEGRIMALEAQYPQNGPACIVVLAEDRFQDLRMTRRTRTFENVSDSDVFNRIANDQGLSPQIDVNGPNYKVLAQVNQSDLAFLRERARIVGAELWLEGSTLHAQSRTGRAGQPVQLSFGAGLREFSVLADLAHQRTNLTASGWDVSGKAGLKYQATDSAIQSELGNDLSGASVLRSALGERKEAVVHEVPLSTQEAQAIAESYFRTHARRFLVGHGVAETSAKLRVGAMLDLQNLGPLFNGRYYVTEVHHLYDQASGVRTEFTAERPGLGRV